MIFGIWAFQHLQIKLLCSNIESGNTEKAIEIISNTSNVNRFSFPLSLRFILNVADADITTPLVVASKTCNNEVVEALLENGANPNKYLKGGFTPLEAALTESNIDRFKTVELLIEYGVDVNLHGSLQSPLFLELSRLMYLNDDNFEQQKICREIVLLLLENGAKTVNDNGDTMIHCLAYANEVELLKKFEPFYNEFLNSQNSYGETPIMWAVKGDSLESVKYLLTIDCDIQAKDVNGMTALDYAIKNGNKEIIDVITN